MRCVKSSVLSTICLSVLVLAIHGNSVQRAAAQGPASNAPKKAICVLHAVGDSGVAGIVTFVQTRDGVEVTAHITGLTPGEHGFHVHEFGDCSAPDGTSAGGHFNPTGMPHAGPDAARRHVGDLGNVTADAKGMVAFQRLDKVIMLNGPNSIVGHSIIVHAGRDDLTSQPSGNAGARAACGVIGIGNPTK